MFVGIDPGKSGAIAIVSQERRLAMVVSMPAQELELANLFSQIGSQEPECVMLEQVHAMPGQGVTSMFTFGQNYGSLRMCLACNGIPFIDVKPQKWQKALLSRTRKKGESATDWKKYILSQAQQRCHRDDRELLTAKNADACMIAEYARLYVTGLL